MSDSNGRLYNKASILEHLLPAEDGSSKAEADAVLQGAVKSLKDVVEVKFEVEEKSPDDKSSGSKKEVWKCPITGNILGPGSKAVYLVPCGHAFSASAIKEVSGEKCLQCDQTYASNDIIPIIPTAPTDIARLSLRLKTLQEQGLTHSLKKAAKESKKRKKREEKDEIIPASVVADEEKSRSVTPRITTPAGENGAGGIQNTSTRALTDKVLQEQEQKKKRKMENNNVRSLFSSRDPTKPHGKSSDFMTRGFSIPANTRR